MAATRAKFALDKSGNVIEPGRLVFLGHCPQIYRAHWLEGEMYPAPMEYESQNPFQVEWEAEQEIREIEGGQW